MLHPFQVQLLLPLMLISTSSWAQIQIEGQNNTCICNGLGNTITYVGDADCSGLQAYVEGFTDPFYFENCAFVLHGIQKETARFELRDQSGAVLLDTILQRVAMNPVAYLEVDSV